MVPQRFCLARRRGGLKDRNEGYPPPNEETWGLGGSSLGCLGSSAGHRAAKEARRRSNLSKDWKRRRKEDSRKNQTNQFVGAGRPPPLNPLAERAREEVAHSLSFSLLLSLSFFLSRCRVMVFSYLTAVPKLRRRPLHRHDTFSHVSMHT